MGDGNKEDLHWRYIDEGGKHPTNFSIILSEGFEVIDTDGGEKEVWLCREVDTASIGLEVPDTSGAHDLKIAARYTNNDGEPIGRRSISLASWRAANWLGVIGPEKAFDTDKIDPATEKWAGFILWPERMRFWNDEEISPRTVGSDDEAAHRVDMKIEHEDGWLLVDWVRLHEDEEQAAPERDKSAKYKQSWDLEQEAKQTKRIPKIRIGLP